MLSISKNIDPQVVVSVVLLLKIAIFVSIIGAAISSRLFSVIRFESIIHEFDPWFNYRATQKLVNSSYYEFFNWFDDRTWYPLGRVTGGTLYPGLMITSAFIWNFLRKVLRLPVDIRNVCVLLAPLFSGLTAIATYLFTKEMKDESAGLLAAAFIAIAPGYISRSVAGSYDNEAIAITLLMVTFYLWIRSMKYGSIFWSAVTAVFYFYMVAAWGGYVFITNLIPLHVFVLLCMGRYNHKLYTSYTTWYAIGTIASMQIPFVGFLPIRSNDHMAALGVFGLLQLVAFGDYVKSKVSSVQFRFFLIFSIILITIIGIFGLVGLTMAGLIAPWTGRFYSLWDTSYAKIHIPIIASVSEHQPTAWPAFFFDTQFLIWLFPAGIYLLFQELKNEHVFVIIYGVLCSYFAGVMVRLMLTLTPIVCVSAAIALSKLFDVYMDFSEFIKQKSKSETVKANSNKLIKIVSKFSVILTFGLYLVYFVYHCTWVTSNAYSSPSVVLASRAADGSQQLIDDYREAYYWLRMNTPTDAKIMSWWDYGYQIGGMADRTTLVDNNTWNNTHIATVGKAMCSSEEVSYGILKENDVDYVLIIFGGVIGFSGDDLNKFLWMVRIAEGLWPDEVKERLFFTARGEYRVDDQASETMKNSLMYKMSYYNFIELYNGRDGIDRVRNQKLNPSLSPELNILEEAFTSENWIVRIYKVKKEDPFGRDLKEVSQFDKQLTGAGRKKRIVKKPQLDLHI
ncbi:dolichyl-diphosphooligosaccharide--protein glycosyltransferase subunit STT3 [Ascoidea rubescens DSM 1968]|uniref:Dolichyl-diphosphooligosaccharide--protein glycosyltransferase subunit STT3 n=1 Tax=Ascoidea rubescens DSM 1968 TaxID=1344418 RepID=A0A1D2VDS4_9ASCO|nr:glycosyltransferase family 66 protein [Ascoidea rubescens DSM 1968]ODV59643.1 glycosyltransferase family 66 protein [Ascoidea rubescens DSM 1968]